MNMQLRNEHVTGFVVGLGAAAAGYYLYRKNQPQVDAFLHKHGIEMPAGATRDPGAMTLEQLVTEKERLEDLIAEREYAAAAEQAAQAKAPKAPATPKPRKKPAAKSAARKPD